MKPSASTIAVRALIVLALVALGGAAAFQSYGGFERIRADALRLVDAPTPGGLSVLFVGNSHTYTYDIPFVVQRLAQADPDVAPMFVEMAAEPGVNLAYHNTPSSRALEMAASREWDVIVLQNRSDSVLDPTSFFDVAASVRAFSPHSRRLVVYQTWAWGEQGGVFDDGSSTQARMQSIVTLMHAKVLEAHPEVEGAPVGDAFGRVRSDLRLRPLGADGNHTNDIGAFVASCVLFTTLTSRPCPEEADRLDISLPDAIARDLLGLLSEPVVSTQDVAPDAGAGDAPGR